MIGEFRDGLRPLPYGGDVDRWHRETVHALQYHLAASGESRAGAAAFESAVGAVRPVERTEWGWVRWGYPLDSEARFEDAFPAEVGVVAPAAGARWKPLLARTVWGRRPAPFLRRIGGTELPAAVSVGRLAVVVAAVLLLPPVLGDRLSAGAALIVAAAAGVALAWGGPGLTAIVTRRHVRVVDATAPRAEYIHRLLALHQEVAAAAAASGVPELRRAAEAGHRFLWDAAGLVLAAGEDSAGLDVVEGYEAAYRRLGVAAAAALGEHECLEHRLADLDDAGPGAEAPGAYLGSRRSRLIEDAAPAELLDELAAGLDELAAGLRDAQQAVARTADGTPRTGEQRHGGR
ncbi:hypothetical protein OG393_32885 (plasmid) [Streptomyces sp. NBC_01216]|uniref:hypothetical protein n=1 Tax=Streptomyces sp. NBC_01216 TaxID=2903778 RepID=UPI002E0F2627|nr:hypothetical protein OG393_32885 [Streptomyces sp. NBC_01216]